MVLLKVHLVGLARSLVGDADCLAGLVALVEDIVNGDLDDCARKLLLSSAHCFREGFRWRSSIAIAT